LIKADTLLTISSNK